MVVTKRVGLNGMTRRKPKDQIAPFVVFFSLPLHFNVLSTIQVQLTRGRYLVQHHSHVSMALPTMDYPGSSRQPKNGTATNAPCNIYTVTNQAKRPMDPTNAFPLSCCSRHSVAHQIACVLSYPVFSPLQNPTSLLKLLARR